MSVLPASSAPGAAAFTSPWIPPPDCTNLYATTSVTKSGSPPTTITVLASIPAKDPDCQPKGWNDDNAQGRLFVFSPAVCPSGWTAYNLGVNVRYDGETEASKTSSHATCCSSGFTLEAIRGVPEETPGILHDACVQAITTASKDSSAAKLATEDTASSEKHQAPEYGQPAEPSYGYTNGIRAHYPWAIKWEATDTASLTPSPPDLGVTSQDVVLRSWVPGETVDPGSRVHAGKAQRRNYNKDENYGPLLAIMIVPSVVGGLIVIGCVTFCVVRCKRNKKRRGQPQPIRLRAADPPITVLDPARTRRPRTQ